MSLKEVKVRSDDLEPGMYVSRLDRPWLDTPYLLQGFELKTQSDIDELRKHCEYVYIDVELSNVIEKTPESLSKSHIQNKEKQFLTNKKPKNYPETTEMIEELKTASDCHCVLNDALEAMMVDITNNKKLDLPALKKAICPMVESVIRNPDAFAWLTRMKSKDNYTYNHSISTSIWSVAFGRHLGLPKKDLLSLAIGGLLFDSGKMKLPDELINNTNRFNQYEFKLIKQHVNHSVEIVGAIDNIDEDIVRMVQTHHERHNGSGYPNAMSGDAIPIFGRIAGIVDCYDAMISNRPFVSAMSPHDAILKLYEWRNIDFQAELIEQFIQVVGIYPVGTIVELSDGRIAAIVSHHKVWRLRPRVMLLLDQNKEAYNNFDVINLHTELTGDDGNPLNIIRSLEPGIFGIDPEQFYL